MSSSRLLVVHSTLTLFSVYGSLGVTSVPEVDDWRSLTINDSYIVAASDGVFENQSPQDVCDLLWLVQSHVTAWSEMPSSCSYSIADCIIDAAFEKGSMDNMAVVLVPVQSIPFLQSHERSLDGEQLRDVSNIKEMPGGSFFCFFCNEFFFIFILFITTTKYYFFFVVEAITLLYFILSCHFYLYNSCLETFSSI